MKCMTAIQPTAADGYPGSGRYRQVSRLKIILFMAVPMWERMSVYGHPLHKSNSVGNGTQECKETKKLYSMHTAKHANLQPNHSWPEDRRSRPSILSQKLHLIIRTVGHGIPVAAQSWSNPTDVSDPSYLE